MKILMCISLLFGSLAIANNTNACESVSPKVSQECCLTAGQQRRANRQARRQNRRADRKERRVDRKLQRASELQDRANVLRGEKCID